MKKLIVIFVLYFSALSMKAQVFSDSLRLSLLTVSPGTELYSTFGHTAIRLQDFKKNYDWVFNYGTFDFKTPHFYLKFALGLLDYQLSIEYFSDFKEGCIYENRSVTEQELNLSTHQKISMVNILAENYVPENRKYRYKFFTDNCSTRPRDIIALTLKDSLILKNTHVKSDVTFRKLFTAYLSHMPWNQFGIELLLGKMTDNKAGYDALFLPDNLKVAIDNAEMNGVPLEKSEHIIFQNEPIEEAPSLFSPVLAAILFLLLALLVQINKKVSYYFDRFTFITFGFLGIFISTLSFASHHNELHGNFVILLFIPSIFLIPFSKNNWKKKLSIISFVAILLTFICIPILPQTFNPAVLLFSCAVAIRCFFNFAEISKKGISLN